MAKSQDVKYSQEDFLQVADELDGLSITLGETVDRYVNTLGHYLNDETTGYQLENQVDAVVRVLERVYDSLDSFDDLIEDENMVVHIERDGEKGVCDLEEDLYRASNGIYDKMDSFRDFLTLIDYMSDEAAEADKEYLRSTEIGAPTRMLADRERIMDISERLNLEYNRIVFSEILARRHTSSDEVMETFNPEPPIYRMLEHEEHADRVSRLNKAFEKNR